MELKALKSLQIKTAMNTAIHTGATASRQSSERKEARKMTREELMKKVYSIAVEMGLGAINEKDFNKIMWTGVADEEIEEYYRFLQKKMALKSL